MKNKNETVTRFEVIDETGRVYTRWRDVSIELSYQDDGRTLKVFVTPRPAKPRDDEKN